MQGFELYGRYITVNGFEITGTTGLGVFIKADYATVLDCYIHGMSDKGIAGYWKEPWPNNATIRDNYIYNVQGGINICGSNWLVENNEVRRLVQRTSGDCDYTRVFGNNNVIRNNKFWGSSKSEIGSAHVDGFQTYDNNGEWLTNCLIENNFVADCHQGMMANSDYYNNSENITFRNNIFTRCWSWGLNMHNMRNMYVYNNVFAYMDMHGVGVRAGTNCVIKNNIFYNAGSNYFVDAGGTMTATNNLIYKTGYSESSSKYPNDILNVDPRFVNISGEDFHLQSSSPAIDRGANCGVTVDMDGNARPNGAGFDIGAYEFGGSTPPPVTPDLAVNNISLNEGNSGSTIANFTVSLSQAASQTVTVNYATANGTATTADSDYAAASGSLSFAAGTTSKTVAVMVNGDTKVEGDETFSLNLSGAANATIADAQGIATIRNDDTAPIPAVSVAETSASEGNSGSTQMTFTVSLSTTTTNAVAVNYATIDGTATTADGDYAAASGTLNFAPGTSSKTVAVSVTGDTRPEGNETMSLRLNSPVNATLGTSQAQGVIVCDDPATGGKVGHFKLDDASGTTVSDSSEQANDGVLGDGTAWADGTLDGALAVNTDNGYAQVGTAGWNTQSGTIALWANASSFGDNPQFLIGHTTTPRFGSRIQLYTNDASGNLCLGLGDSHSTATNIQALAPNTWYHVALTWNGSAYTVFVDGQAKASGTYTGLDTFNTFADIGNNGHPDWRIEGFNGRLDDVQVYNCVLTDAEIEELASAATPPPPPPPPSTTPEITIGDARQDEGNSGSTNFVFTVTLSEPTDQVVTVDYATQDYHDASIAATAGSDYTAKSGTLTFPAGTTTQTVSVAVSGDTLYERTERFNVKLSNPLNATVAAWYGLGIIVNDEIMPKMSINDVIMAEGNSGTKTMSFSVTADKASQLPATFGYVTADWTAQAGSDYAAASGTVTIPAGATSASIAITISGDTATETDEAFVVDLVNGVDCGFIDARGIGVIQNDDIDSSLPVISISDCTVTERDSGTRWAAFTVSLSQASSEPLSVYYTTQDGSATSPSDYIAEWGPFEFNPGQTRRTISVKVVGDVVREPTESYSIILVNPDNCTIGKAVGTCTIYDND